MEYMGQQVLGNTVLAWSLASGIACILLAALILIKRFTLRRVAAFAERTRTDADDLLVALLRQTKTFSLVAAALYAGSQGLVLGPRWEQAGRTGIVVTLLLQAAFWLAAAVQFALVRTSQRRVEGDAGSAATLHILGFASKVAIWSIFLLMALDNLGINVTGLVAGMGIGGIAVALAIQNILGDLFASLSIILDKPFEVGDFIIVGDFLGVVEHIGIKTTRVRSLSGEQIIFSNGDLLGSRVRNYKRMAERRVVFTLGVTFQTPHHKLEAIPPMLREIVESREHVRFDRAHFQAIGDTALVFEIVYYLLDPDYTVYMDSQQAINLAIMRRFEAEGIAFAYPTQTLFIEGGEPGRRAG